MTGGRNSDNKPTAKILNTEWLRAGTGADKKRSGQQDGIPCMSELFCVLSAVVGTRKYFAWLNNLG